MERNCRSGSSSFYESLAIKLPGRPGKLRFFTNQGNFPVLPLDFFTFDTIPPILILVTLGHFRKNRFLKSRAIIYFHRLSLSRKFDIRYHLKKVSHMRLLKNTRFLPSVIHWKKDGFASKTGILPKILRCRRARVNGTSSPEARFVKYIMSSLRQ